jgi:hypothetical protein
MDRRKFLQTLGLEGVGLATGCASSLEKVLRKDQVTPDYTETPNGVEIEGGTRTDFYRTDTKSEQTSLHHSVIQTSDGTKTTIRYDGAGRQYEREVEFVDGVVELSTYTRNEDTQIIEERKLQDNGGDGFDRILVNRYAPESREPYSSMPKDTTTGVTEKLVLDPAHVTKQLVGSLGEGGTVLCGEIRTYEDPKSQLPNSLFGDPRRIVKNTRVTHTDLIENGFLVNRGYLHDNDPNTLYTKESKLKEEGILKGLKARLMKDTNQKGSISITKYWTRDGKQVMDVLVENNLDSGRKFETTVFYNHEGKEYERITKVVDVGFRYDNPHRTDTNLKKLGIIKRMKLEDKLQQITRIELLGSEHNHLYIETNEEIGRDEFGTPEKHMVGTAWVGKVDEYGVLQNGKSNVQGNIINGKAVETLRPGNTPDERMYDIHVNLLPTQSATPN